MAQTKLLLDSNSYFRLAKDIHPLLFREFGTERYCLYVLPEVDHEYNRQPRLHTKFPWVNDPEFRTNRQRSLSISRQQKTAIATAWDFMWDHVQTTLPGPSRIDVTILSHGYVLNIPVVTDDVDMRELATVYDVKVLKTLELLKLMLDCRHIDMNDVRRIVGYWSWLGDRPASFTADYRELFSGAPSP